jgi:hypothetical protein
MSSATSPNRRVAAGRCTIFSFFFLFSYITKRYCNEHSNRGLQFEWVERGWIWSGQTTGKHTHTQKPMTTGPLVKNKQGEYNEMLLFSLSLHRHILPMWYKPIKDSWDEIWLKSTSPSRPCHWLRRWRQLNARARGEGTKAHREHFCDGRDQKIFPLVSQYYFLYPRSFPHCNGSGLIKASWQAKRYASQSVSQSKTN